MPAIEYNVVIAYVFGLILLYFVGWILLVPLKIVIKLLYNSILGGIALVIINFFGGFIGVHVGINPLTALIVGVLGIPGMALLLLLQFFLKI
ncbi:pro-sigmaK processing inhibitor BofA family protein [Petroclostridium sp. X23]|jgi:inhibitor of the pro-sigma K processing machinery|uniref:pro-sigmaK processing inhibitor BofA family protein n=1 Tax=Petroclostridium sp. X23 TaxID=3045146 RepID=UPI0024AD8ED4|nr:pro-sigmaK processing inhibitor BofA family protein [Petroclostridium sp. X23]WHH57105.1 pro-sigmaK processing inhibitor BofA family protein [Petroclostridium sp. X23]